MLKTDPLRSFAPRGMIQTSLGVMQHVAAIFEDIGQEAESQARWRELQNKLCVFELFEHPDMVLGLAPETHVSLQQQVQLAYTLDPYRAVWVTEGIGHDYAETFWIRGETPRGIMSGKDSFALPDQSLVPLHAGMGLSLAQHALEGCTASTSARAVQNRVRQFIQLCDSNSRRGYVGVAYESLGLAARNVFPHLVEIIDKELRQISEETVAYFWHGVGRAIYFTPTSFFPTGTPLKYAMDRIFREPPHEIGRTNALAGLAWALALVNIQDPVVMEVALKNHGERLARENAFANGVSSGILIWYDSTRNSSLIENLCRHEPHESDEFWPTNLWDRQVRRPCEDALRRYYRVLKAKGRLGEVFRYQQLSAM